MVKQVQGFQTDGGRFFSSELEARLNETEEALVLAIERTEKSSLVAQLPAQDTLLFLRDFDKLIYEYLTAFQATLVTGLAADGKANESKIRSKDDKSKAPNFDEGHPDSRR